MQADHKLAAFLYVLMRDHVTLGVIESIIAEHIDKSHSPFPVFSNLHLADYAYDVANRLGVEKPNRRMAHDL